MKSTERNLLTNMYREQHTFAYCKKQYTRMIHVSINDKNPNFIHGFVTKWGEIKAHFMMSKKTNKLYLYSFMKKKMIEEDSKTKTFFKHIRKTIENYEAILEAEELKIAV